MNKLVLLWIVIIQAGITCIAQEQLSLSVDTSLIYNHNLFDKINQKAISLQNNIEKKTLHTLQQLQKQENKLKNKLVAKDSSAASNLFTSASSYSFSPGEDQGKVYQTLANTIKNPPAFQSLKEYIPQFDSLKTSLKFLNQSSLTSKLPAGMADKIKAANTNIQGLETKLQQASDIKTYIKERKEILKVELEKYGMLKDMKKLNKEVYYYQQQLNEYKEILKDPKKIEQKLISELTKLPAFTAFMKKNSQLAQLFRLPDNYGTPESLTGLQTRTSVQAQLQQRFGAAASFSAPLGGAGEGYVQQQVQQAQGELTKLKDKLNKNPLSMYGEGAGGEVPDFKPNNQKTKSFLKRIEYGANVQSQKTNFLLPVTSDLALTAGYKINDRSIIGLGLAYKLGWGSGWKHIKLTNEGVGLRSYIDWKIAPIFGKIEGFWLTGGYEQNYQHAFAKIDQLKDLNAWQTSGLIGITKKYKIGNKTNNLQLLWDFLSYRQVPVRQAVVFRVGFKF